MFFNGWEAIGRTLLVGLLAYIGLVLFLRVSGKRTLSKMNAFDLVVTVALGSTLATILLNQKVSLVQGLTAFFVLIGMQYMIAALSVRSTVVSRLIKSKPQLLYYQGQYLRTAMKKARVLEVEILQAARSDGIGSMDEVHAVVLETDGRISIIKNDSYQGRSTLTNVQEGG
ncbi:DUF421 domain-containing protein [Virgibacillus xinjiangensis]|uniref:DUF421 domain-containing protein n=1 Tax=Virgibacillus xinjiangensis TaxID=393090 RepID=A0ABV7CXB7_9BACI